MKKLNTEHKTQSNDLLLIKKIIKNNCSPSFQELRDRHAKLFYSVCNRFSNRLPIDEVHKDLDFVFFKAILSFKSDRKAKFSTWLGNYTRYHCLNYIKSNSKYVTSEEDTINHFFDKKAAEDFDPVINFKNDLDHAFDVLEKMSDKRIFRIFRLRYNDKGPKLTWKEIAAQFDLTPQTIINLHTKGRRLIRKKMKDHDIFAKK